MDFIERRISSYYYGKSEISKMSDKEIEKIQIRRQAYFIIMLI